MAGNRRHDISFVIGIASMAMWSSSGFEQWVYGIGRFHHGRHGKTGMRRDLSVRSDGTVLTMLSCSANGISVICSILTKDITTTLGRTCRCIRTRRSRVPSRPSVTCWRCQFWADCTTNISEREFPTGTPDEAPRSGAKSGDADPAFRYAHARYERGRTEPGPGRHRKGEEPR